MAPLAQWAIQILSGSLSAKDRVSSCGTQWQVTPQAKDNAATSPVGSMGLTATSPMDYRIDVYAGPFDDGSIGHKRGIWDSWFPTIGYENLGGSIKGPPLAVSSSPNVNDIFAVGRDDRLWHKALREDSTWDPSRYEWRDLGGNLSSDYRLTGAGSESRVDVFGVREENGGTKSLWRQSWNGSSWLPGLEHLNGHYSTAPFVTSRLPGELSLFIVDVDTNLRHRHYKYSDRQWNAWETIGTGFRSAPAAFAITPDRLDVFGIKDDGDLYHRAWVANKLWSEWENFGGQLDEIVSVARFDPEFLLLVGRKADGSYRARLYAWDRPVEIDGWESLGGAFASQPALACSGHLDMNFFGIGLDGALLYQGFDMAKGFYPGPRAWQPLAEGPK